MALLVPGRGHGWGQVGAVEPVLADLYQVGEQHADVAQVLDANEALDQDLPAGKLA
jgi:hypothetical protein